MLGELAKQGIAIALTLACFEHPGGTVAPYKRESFWRKPNPGMVLEAVRRLGLDPARSAFLGDQQRDMEAAFAGGIGARMWLGGTDQDGAKGVKDFSAGLALLRNLNPTLFV
jgi:D-glycero-D-manno-heptose 1,7-bisphosphate phosphatase